MKPNILFLLLFICTGLVFGQFENISAFEQKLIKNEITGNNVAMVYQGGEVVYHHIENSMHKQGKYINNNSIFPIWSSPPKSIYSISGTHYSFNKLKF